jgi:hypothetical protein
MDYFYDKQIRKYIVQFIRIFSDFKSQRGFGQDGSALLRTVPVNYGDPSRIVAHIMKNNSENTINTVPFISVYITDMQMAPDRRTHQKHNVSAYVTEKEYDAELGEYTDQPGERYEVKRHAPVPYNITINVDVWTSNSNQKFELLEQLLVLFNPHINLRTNDNPIDWSSLTYMEMTSLQWSGRSIPSGADDVIDVATLQFKIPVLINPPVQVKRQRMIHTIINKLDMLNDENLTLFNEKESFESQFTSYIIVTPGQLKAKLQGDTVTMIDQNNTLDQLNWQLLIEGYGEFQPGYSQIRFRRNNDVEDDSNDIIGTFSFNEQDPSKLLVTLDPDTIPNNTLGTIDDVINPLESYPGDGDFATPVVNQRYLITQDISSQSLWQITAFANDIIIFDGTTWSVFFSSGDNQSIETVYDNQSDSQLEWDGTSWRKSYDGIYSPGYWRLYL